MMTPDQVLYSGVLRRIVSRGKKDMVAAPIVKAPYGRGGEANSRRLTQILPVRTSVSIGINGWVAAATLRDQTV